MVEFHTLLLVSYTGMQNDPFLCQILFPTLEGTVSLLYLEIQVHRGGPHRHCLCTHTLCSVPGITLVGEIQVPQRHKFTWCARIMKFFVFLIPVFTGLWYLAVDDTLQHDAVNATSKTSFIALYVGCFQYSRQHLGSRQLESFFLAGGFPSSLYWSKREDQGWTLVLWRARDVKQVAYYSYYYIKVGCTFWGIGPANFHEFIKIVQ